MKKLIATLTTLTILFIMITACRAETQEPEPVPEPVQDEVIVEQNQEPDVEPEQEPEQQTEPEHEHEWQEANFQQPRICLVCGETDGEPLQAQFPLSGFTLSEIGVTYPYVSINLEGNMPIIGEVAVTEVIRHDGNAMFESRDGYEWIFAIVTFGFSDPTWRLALWFNIDYYNFDLSRELGEAIDDYDGEDDEFAVLQGPFFTTVNFLGADYEITMFHEVLYHSRNVWASLIAYHVPIGFDGMILMPFNSENNPRNLDENYDGIVTLGDLLDSDTLFFRLSRDNEANLINVGGNSAAEIEVFELVNAERERFGLDPLIWSNGLAYEARQHCIDMSELGIGGSDIALVSSLYDIFRVGLVYIFPVQTRTLLESHSTATEFFESQNWIQQVGGNTHIGIGNHGDYWYAIFSG